MVISNALHPLYRAFSPMLQWKPLVRPKPLLEIEVTAAEDRLQAEGSESREADLGWIFCFSSCNDGEQSCELCPHLSWLCAFCISYLFAQSVSVLLSYMQTLWKAFNIGCVYGPFL